ncbi:hypothetical protein LIER_07391 [Lithospermum erythrorhizon]|uniref:Retrovirus-related pol polyprotein from transposon tnt 1-94 n=1 Tax=Lithospermum erythrorhizon TaxID=34254 RepID=A0AAV3PAM2_LITER
MLCTRPDVSYALSITSRYQANLGESHWIAVKCILKYLRRTKDAFLRSSKQSTVTDSTTESEYIAASEAAKEACWIKKFVIELGIVPSIEGPVELLSDNTRTIAQAKEPRAHHKSKHVPRKYHLIRDMLNKGDIKVCKVATEANLADPFTKPLSQAKLDEHATNIGLTQMSQWC